MEAEDSRDQSSSNPDETSKATAANSVMAERKRLAAKIGMLKNEKLRKELEELEAEAAAEANTETKAAADHGQQGAAAAGAAAMGKDASPKGPTPVPDARPRKRHWLTLASFLVLVLLPTLVTAWYLWNRTHDRYVSYTGFSVRTEEVGSALELLGGVAELSGSSSSDTDILYKFIQSQELVQKIDDQIDLRAIWSRPGRTWANADHDPVFAYNPTGAYSRILSPPDEPAGGSIEDLTDHWRRMVNVYSDSGTGLIDLEVEAFTAPEAQAIAQLIYDESSAMINRLSAIAREDATRYAREELDQAVERLKVARSALTRFRNQSQIVDPSASIQGQMGILTSLQQQLAETLIELDILEMTSRPNDPRITQNERRAEVIENRIEQERRKLGIGSSSDTENNGDPNAFANLVGEYESLAVDLEFAEQSYTAALAAYDSALAEAQRQSRYLAAHVNPTLAQSPTRPDRFSILGLTALFSFLTWAILVLAAYALRDRR
ncbi:capsule biosynthesis protein [Roseovarius sp. MMSF_3281]|uniref:capsule biosynthesis protein n=1 Tax=Roseovarius sp. MMSF_3281 TaxID=3046694 RepID=UPI00273DCD4B|nr:capsule biosynthesis protein [Roseovarius sp. MMSF_3281]